MALASTSYTPRRPEDSVLHRLVREHLATFLAHTEATYAAPLPLVRDHGVFAARSSGCALVTPKPPDGVARRKKSKTCGEEQEDSLPPPPANGAVAARTGAGPDGPGELRLRGRVARACVLVLSGA